MKMDKDLKILIEDLISSVKNAAWLDSAGESNLRCPTIHMDEAIYQLERVLYRHCSTCGQKIKED